MKLLRTGSYTLTISTRLKNLIDLRQSIAGIDCLEHIALLDQEIRQVQAEIQQEEIRDFLRGFG